ncbi:MAG: L,D-transpeptidase [Cellulosilyticaceae bacterium]
MKRRNTIIFFTASILSCSVLLAEPIENVNEGPIPSPSTTVTAPTIIDENAVISKEILLNETYNLPNAVRYERMINSVANPIVNNGLIAQILCDYIGQSPIYLNDEKTAKDPYIGRLILEGIWCDATVESTKTPTYGGWKNLLKRCDLYLQDKTFKNQALNERGETTKKQIEKWRSLENAQKNFSKIALGKMAKDAEGLKYENKQYPLYNIFYTTYVSVKDLGSMGLNVDFTKDKTVINTTIIKPAKIAVSTATGKSAFLNTQKVYVGNLETYSLAVGDDVLIPVKTLQNYYNMESIEKNWVIKAPIVSTTDYLQINENKLQNVSDEVLDVSGMMLFWNGEKIVQEPLRIAALAPTEGYAIGKNLYALDDRTIYLTTIIQSIKGVTTNIVRTNQYGQINETLYKQYELAIKEEQKKIEAEKRKIAEEKNKLAPKTLEKTFPPSLIIGTMRQSTNGFKNGEKVEITMAEEGKYYYAKKGLQTIKIPWRSVSIPSNPQVEKKQAEVKQIEAYINSKNFSSKTGYLVWTDLYRQRTYIFKGKQNNWKLYKDFLCSTGKNITPTPRGEYALRSYVPYFGVSKGYRCKNAIQISGDYLYHSIIFDKTGTYLLEGKGVLGQRASQGCIRFSEENSAWFYSNMPLGTKVWIN